MQCAPKVLGKDFELANAIVSRGRRDAQAGHAAREILREISGYPLASRTHLSTDWGRRWLATSGGSVYIDLQHVEVAVPEHRSAFEHPTIVHAGLQMVRDAQVRAARELDPSESLRVLACVSDRHVAWGCHTNVLVTRRFFDDLFSRKPHLAGFLATHLATMGIYAGQGQVGAGNGRSACTFQISQRADWVESLFGEQTTHARPLINMRDEPHAGPAYGRLHVINTDLLLCPRALTLQAGSLQLVLAMAEAGWIRPELQLEDPVAAVSAVSRDIGLRRPLSLVGRGRRLTAVEIQRAIAEAAGEFITSPVARGVVPDGQAIVGMWLDTLDLLERSELDELARRVDWALKFLILDRARGRRNLTWESAELKLLDLLYGSLDPSEGTFFQVAAEGAIEGFPTLDAIERWSSEPPEDTRAYLRAHALRRWGGHVVDLDWDHIRFRREGGRYWASEATLVMPEPHGMGRSESAPMLEGCRSVEELVEEVGSTIHETRSRSGRNGSEVVLRPRGGGEEGCTTGDSL